MTPSDLPSESDLPLVAAIRERTPARLLVGRSGPSYRTATQLELRRDHAAAVDAVRAELDLQTDFEAEFRDRWDLFEVVTEVKSKDEYLRRPDLGRRLSVASRETLRTSCPAEADLQIVIGDGLSAAAVKVQVPLLLPLLVAEAKEAGWRVGRPFLVRFCRVGVMNDVGDVLRPTVVVLLIGERPGLATAESLSAYMAYRPRAGDTDAQRNLISNIHGRGVPFEQAARRIRRLAEKMRAASASGVQIKE